VVDAQFRTHINRVKWQRMAERNQFVGSLGGLYPSKSCHGEQVALGKGVVRDPFSECRRYQYTRFGYRASLRDGLGSDINHGRSPMFIKVRQSCGSALIRRVPLC
jgi:hypothetical protein